MTTINYELIGTIILSTLGILGIIALNLLWIFGINGEIRATAISFDIMVVTLFLRRLAALNKQRNGD